MFIWYENYLYFNATVALLHCGVLSLSFGLSIDVLEHASTASLIKFTNLTFIMEFNDFLILT